MRSDLRNTEYGGISRVQKQEALSVVRWHLK
jgi:hypothetical protein